MSTALETTKLGKRYGRTWALRECEVKVPAGRVAALVGPNGAGKTTLLNLAIGLLRPTEGEVRVFGCLPRGYPLEVLPYVGFVAQDHPLYRGFSVADLLTMGRKLNPRWDQKAAVDRMSALDIPLKRRADGLSGGQQAQVAMFLGAPLVAGELERGTYRLVWTQSVTRLRWMVGKVGALMGITLLLFALISLLVMWWNGPFDRLGGGVEPWSFDFEGIVPLAYMAYALSLAIAASTLLRKTVPAMFVTLVGYLAARIPIGTWARPYYVPPLSVTWDPYITTPKVLPGGQDWILFQNYVGNAGHPVPTNPFDTCGAGGPIPVGRGTTVWDGLVTACTHAHGWLYTATWQPAERFWLFQGIESAIFLGLAAALLALAFWWVRERIS